MLLLRITLVVLPRLVWLKCGNDKMHLSICVFLAIIKITQSDSSYKIIFKQGNHLSEHYSQPLILKNYHFFYIECPIFNKMDFKSTWWPRFINVNIRTATVTASLLVCYYHYLQKYISIGFANLWSGSIRLIFYNYKATKQKKRISNKTKDKNQNKYKYTK